MDSVDKIQSAQDSVAELQQALDSVQDGLRHAEEVAVAAEEAKRSFGQVLKIALVLTAVCALVIVVSSRRRRR